MIDIDKVAEHYKYMSLNDDATLPEISRQYKDLIILWHPDKHHGDTTNYHKYEDKTKLLNEAYNDILQYHNECGKPSFKQTDHNNNAYDINDIPLNLREYDEKMQYSNDCNTYNIGVSICNAMSSAANALISVSNFFEKQQYKYKVACVTVLKDIASGINVQRHTIRINNVSLSRKVDFLDRTIKQGNYIRNNIIKSDYNYSFARYLDFLTEHKFCGIENSNWRTISYSEISILLLLARASGYNIKKSSSLVTSIHGTICNAEYLDYIPLNGNGFRDYLSTIGFYNMDNRYYWCKGGDSKYYIFDIELCTLLDFNKSADRKILSNILNKSAALWPANSRQEQRTDNLLN